MKGIEKATAAILAAVYMGAMMPAVVYGEAAQRKETELPLQKEIRETGKRSAAERISGEGGEVSLGRARILIPRGALERETEIRITKLEETEGTGEELINVTEGGGGYRFEPAGTQFKKEVRIEIPYEKKLNEKEGQLEEARTYYYQKEEGRWEELERKGYDRERGVIQSVTVHFTDMINGTLSVPESAGPAEININSIKGLEAADAGRGAGKIEGLEGVSSGSAVFAVRIEVPEGRRGMTPDVRIRYDSAGGTGLMGKGFELEYGSRIETDTRRGAARYDGRDEYMIDGVKLSKGASEKGVTEYARERESEYSQIRHRAEGNYWEVIEKDGRKKTYGQGEESWGGISEEKKNIWNIEKEEDINGNTIEYEYEKEKDLKKKTQYVYLKTIYYTGKGGERGKYKIEVAYESRADKRVDGRGGYLREQGKRIREIRVYGSGGSEIRSYGIRYTEGIAKESFVKEICGYDGAGEEWWKYGFEYEELESRDGAVENFGEPVRYGEAPLWVTRSESSGIQFSGGAGIGTGEFTGLTDVRVSGGGQTSDTDSITYSETVMTDINGDGRIDGVRQAGGRLYVRLNTGDGFTEEKGIDVEGLESIDIEKERWQNRSGGWNVYAGLATKVSLMGGGGGPVQSEQNGTGGLTSGFQDMDGDGLVDIAVSGEEYYYRNISKGGETGFRKTLITIEGDEGYEKELSKEEKERYGNRYYIERPFRMWKAPYEGEVEIEQRVEKSGSGKVETAVYDSQGRIEGSEVTVSGEGTGRTVIDAGVGKGSGLYYIHELSGEEGDIRHGDIKWNIGIRYTKVKAFAETEEVIEYVPKEILKGSELGKNRADLIYTEVHREEGPGQQEKEYRLKGDWEQKLSAGGKEAEEMKSFLYRRGYYLPRIIGEKLFEKIAEGKSREELEELGRYYVYDSGRKEYRKGGNEGSKEERDRVRDILTAEEKGKIQEELGRGEIKAVEEGGEIQYEQSGTGVSEGHRGRETEGSVYDEGEYIALGKYRGKEVRVQGGEYYIEGKKSGYAVKVEVNGRDRKVTVREGRGAEWEADLIWIFGDAWKKAGVIEKGEMERIWKDGLFDGLYTERPRTAYKIEGGYWEEIKKEGADGIFREHITRGLITEAEAEEYFKEYFTEEAVTKEGKEREVDYYVYKRKKELSREEKERANGLLEKIERAYFFETAYPCYEEGEAEYKLKEEYAGESEKYDTYIQTMTEKYKLEKYGRVEKRVRYNSSHIYEVKEGKYRYMGIGADGISFEEKESDQNLVWDSGRDYGVENRAGAKGFIKAGWTAGPAEESEAEKEERKKVVINSGDILYGGEKNWYYGIWAGDEKTNAFSEKRLKEQQRAAEEVIKATEGMSREESEAYMKEEGERKKKEAEENGGEGKETEGSSRKYYLPQNSTRVREQYGSELPGEEGETGREVTDTYLMGEITAVTKQILGWSGNGRKMEMATRYYFSYMEGDVIHTGRKGGDLYYEIPGILRLAGRENGIGMVRRSESSGRDRGVSIGIGVESDSVSENTSESRMVRNIQDINGDGTGDIVWSQNGVIKVKYGRTEGGGEIWYGGEEELGWGNELSLSHSDVSTSGVGISCGPTVELGKDLKTGTIRSIQMPGNAGLSGSRSSASGRNRQVTGIYDINGDGLGDYINGSSVRLGTGYGYTEYSVKGMSGSLSESSVLSASGSLGVGTGKTVGASDSTQTFTLGAGAGISSGSSASWSTLMLLDINGDGLPDIVRKKGVKRGESEAERKRNENILLVKYNTGTEFLEETEIRLPGWGEIYTRLKEEYEEGNAMKIPVDNIKQIPVIGLLYQDKVKGERVDISRLSNELDFTTAVNVGLNGGMNAGGTAKIKVLGFSVNISANGNVGQNAGSGLTNITVKMLDINGDGYTDQVLRIPGGETYAKLNLGAKAGLLKKIELPQGGSYELEYTEAGNTNEMPQSRQVLSCVRVNDGEIGRGAHSYITKYSYTDGYYERSKKEFYGFGEVTAEYGDKSRTVTAYNNREYHTKGTEQSRAVYNEKGEKLSEQLSVYDRAPHCRITERVKRTCDERSGLYTEIGERYRYDGYGNVKEIYDEGDTADPEDGIRAEISYWNDEEQYLHNHPERIEIKDALGVTLRKREGRYNGSGQLESLKQYWKEDSYVSVRYSYDIYGNIKETTDSAGVTTGYTYDTEEQQYITEIVQRGSGGQRQYVSTLEWDIQRGLKTGETDANGNRIEYAYDEKCRLKSVRAPYDTGKIPAVSYSYSTEAGKRWYAVTANKITFDGDDESVMLTAAEVDGIGRARRTGKSGSVYDTEIAEERSGWNISGETDYDAKGRAVREGQLYFAETAEGEAGVRELLEGDGKQERITEKEYDSLDRVTKITLPDMSVIEKRYGVTEEGGKTYTYTQTIDPLENVSIEYCDARGNRVKTERRDRNNRVLTKAEYRYNGLGEMQRAEDAAGQPVQITYDMLGRKESLESRDGGREEYGYNEKGQLWRITDSELKSRGKYIEYIYDEFGRTESIDYPESEDVKYTWGEPQEGAQNRAGRITKIEDESGIMEYEYGKLGETIRERRRVKQRTDGLGLMREAVMEYRGDYLGRMQEIVYPDGERVRYGYTYGGNVSSVTGEKQGVAFPYVKKIGYDEWGQRVYLKLGNGAETKYRYDENRRWLSEIETVGQGNTVLQRIQYRFDAAGNVSGYTNRAGSYTVEQEYVYDGLYQLTGAKGKTESRQYGLIDYRAEYEQAYIFDEAGQGKMMEKVSGTLQSDGRVLGDDLNYRLDYEYAEGYVHRVSRAGKQYYRYDRNGNVTAEQDRAFAEEGGGTEGKAAVTELGNGVYVADTGWGMIEGGAAGGAGWSGGVSKGNRRIYRWNEKNELKGTSDSRYHVEYSYGADGARSGKYSVASDGGSGTETLYFNSMWTWRYDGQAGGVVGRNSKHIYVGDTRVVTKIGKADGSFTGEENIKQYYYHSDHLGSAQLITNASGEEYERIEYTPYGELWIEKASVATNIDIPYRFTGKEMDSETGLYYYGARYLDPKYSRWLSPDPALGEYIPGAPVNEEARRRNGNLPGMGGVFNTVNLQLYHYAGNNPVKYVDPDGRAFAIDDVIVIGVIVGIVALANVIKNAIKEHSEPASSLNPSPIIADDALKIPDSNSEASSQDENSNNPDATSRDINDSSNPTEWPDVPDDWVLPEGVTEEPKTKENTGGKHCQWKDSEGNIVRRWDAAGRENGRERGQHWHDGSGNHILPGGGIDN